MGLTSKGKDFIKYLKTGAKNNPEYEKTIEDVTLMILNSKGVEPTRQAVVDLLLTMEEMG
jgi:hypothetical protein